MIILSVLMATTPDRDYLFHPLYDELNRQIHELHVTHPTLGRVEVLVDSTKRFLDGGLSIGKKRQGLYRRSNGRYACCVDVDDWVSPNYVESLVRLCHHGRDIVTFRNITKLETYWMMVDMSLHFQNDQANPNFIVRRKPWTICPVKTEFAKMFEFPDTNYSEDSEWMEKVLTMCTSEAHSEQVLHEYRHGKHSESDKIIKAGYK